MPSATKKVCSDHATKAIRDGKVHPILKKVGLFPSHTEGPSPLDILNYLLLSKLVKEADVEAAHKAIKEKQCLPVEGPEVSQSKVETKNAFDKIKTYRTRHVALRFYYDGANYSGLAENVGYDGDQSVEKALFAALKKTSLVVTRDASQYSRCGRTDKGVSSAGQVVGIYLKSSVSLDATWDQEGKLTVHDEDLPKNSIDKVEVWVRPKKDNGPRLLKEVAELPYEKMLNNVLPENIRVLGWCPVSPDFNARFSCSRRTYRYFFNPRQLNVPKMREGLRMMVGTHDFRNFCKMDVEKVYNFERKIHYADITSASDHIFYFEIVGQAFLWHQIRCIVAVLFMIGRGDEEPSIVTELLDVKKYPGKPSYQLAPERSLVLHDCGFPNLTVGYDAKNCWSLCCQLEQQWEEFTLSAARVRNCVESLSGVLVLRNDFLEFAKAMLRERSKKQGHRYEQSSRSISDCLAALEVELPSEVTFPWKKAMASLASWQIFPSPENLRLALHVPLLQRSKGTTYEEKVESLQQSTKRKQKYEENIIKKRKTKEEDHAFYAHMAKQGGSAI